MNMATDVMPKMAQNDLTEILNSRLANPQRSANFDLFAATASVLADVGLSTADSGGKLTFYGQDPILPSPLRFGSMAAIALAARSVAVAALWRQRSGDGQDILVDVRKSLRRFAGFFEGKWETVNGRPPSAWDFAGNPFLRLPLFRETRDGRHVIALDFYPRLRARMLNLLRCSESAEAIDTAILQWRADDLENAAAEQGVVLAKVRSYEELRRELQYTEVLAHMPLISVEKIADSDPVPFSCTGQQPLSGIRALGMGHVIAGGAIGRDLAFYGSDVLNIWRPNDSELEPFAWDAQVSLVN